MSMATRKVKSVTPKSHFVNSPNGRVLEGARAIRRADDRAASRAAKKVKRANAVQRT